MVENMAEMKEYRAKLFHDSADFKKCDRVPHLGAYITWKIIDAGYKFSEAFNDFNIMEECVRRFIEKYPVDSLMDTGVRNSFNVQESFGKGYYYYDDKEEVVGVHAYELASIEELDEYVQDTTKFLWTKAMPRKYADFKEKTLADWQKTYDEFAKFNNYAAHISKVIGEEYGLPALSSPAFGFVTPFIETLFGSIRGIKGLSIDLRRNQSKIKAAVETMDAKNIDPVVAKIMQSENGHDFNACFDLSILMLAHTVLNNKVFDDIYWPTLGKIIRACEEKGKNMRITVEGAGERLFDHFAEFKKGTLSLLLEQDDIFEARKKLPDCCLIGGMLTTTLGKGSKQECLDLTKRLVDEIGADGGYIFSTNKFVSYRNDANPENLKAVSEFILDYKG